MAMTGDGAGPSDYKWDADAAFSEHAFLTVEWFVERSVPAGAAAGGVDLMDLEWCSVVADVEDEGVFGEVEFFELGDDRADTVVHGGDHRQRLAAALGHLAGEAVEVFFRRVERAVGRAVG